MAHTKGVIVTIYDAIAVGNRLGMTYQARRNPLPADPRLAHEPRQ